MNVLHRAQAIIPHIRGSYLSFHFPEEFIRNLSHDRAQPGKCIKCLNDMAHHDMHPPGRITPRAICPKCWAVLTSQLTQNCWVCGSWLDQQTIEHQQRAPQDIHHRIHDGKCMDYFSLVSARALGVNTGVCESPKPGLVHPNQMIEKNTDFSRLLGGVIEHPPQITYEPQQTANNIITMVPVRQRVKVK